MLLASLNPAAVAAGADIGDAVRIGGATTDAIVRQVEACPSGALSWERDQTAAPPPAAVEAAPSAPVITTSCPWSVFIKW